MSQSFDNILNFCFGGISGATGAFIVHPIDTIKTNIQSSLCKHNKIADCVKDLYKVGGLRAFYSGVTSAMIGVMSEKAIVFSTYEHVYRYIENAGQYELITHFFSGNVAGVMCSLVTTPTERVKILLQNKSFDTTKSCVTGVVRHGGIFSIYQGLSYTMLRESLGFGTYFATFKTLNRNFSDCDDKKSTKCAKTFCFGGASGVISWLIIYPIDNFKTIAQSSLIKNSFSEIYSTVTKSGNIYGFNRGFPMAISRAFSLHGGVFLTYELLKTFNNI
jgi:hypothetical protein